VINGEGRITLTWEDATTPPAPAPGDHAAEALARIEKVVSEAVAKTTETLVPKMTSLFETALDAALRKVKRE
jgi:hypothetical protein